MAALPITWKAGSDVQTYEKARIGRVFNHRRPDRYPIAVIEAKEESHIVEAVRLARETNCRLSVRSGGHSWAAWSVRDGAILLDLGQYKQIDLDEKTGIVQVSPSTTGRMLNGFLTTKGRLFAGGHCPDVGLGGFLLQGGMGWNCKITDGFDPDTEVVLVASYPPGSKGIVHTVLFVAFKNDPEEARRALQPAQDSHPAGTVHEWFNRETSLQDQYKDQGAANPEGHRYRVDNAYISNDADVASVLEEAFTTLPTKKTFSLWYSMSPGTRRPLGDSDFQVRRTRFWGEKQGVKLMELRRKWDPKGTICGYLDEGDKSQQNGLANVHEWSAKL